MKELVLKALREESHVSGEDLGRRLKISRTAVWKHIQELRRQGYKIESSPKLGYSYIESTSLLLPEEITPGLQTQTIGKYLLHRDEVTSTQDIAEKLAREGAKEGTVVIAETQNRGRGRKGRNWISPPEGGVYLSIILRPNLMPSRIVQIPLIAGIAANKAIRRTTPLQPSLKWPNDIIINGKKAGGILTEMNSEIDGVNYIILGIGLNINTPVSLLAGITNGIATSLAYECGEHVSRVKLVQHLFCEFEVLYTKFVISGFASLRDEWKKLNNTIGSRVRISDGDVIEGEALDIDEDGFLLVRMENGDMRRIIGGDVTLLDN
ncbi:MAG: biotin--[acetyl-CoA-carboxylase] ligase [Dehalococcoidales bacterium]|nr:biotin--[acetyl-CoA-carboxylase] ligase [Dehalococcoidales bacterium]